MPAIVTVDRVWNEGNEEMFVPTSTCDNWVPAPLALGLLPLQRDLHAEGLVGAVLQKRDQRLHEVQGMKDITAAGGSRHGQGLSGPQAAPRVGNRRLGMEASILKFQQADAPRLGVAMLFQVQQIAIGGPHVGPDQHGLPALENLVVGADADARKVLLTVVRAGLLDRALQDVVDLADRDGIIQ